MSKVTKSVYIYPVPWDVTTTFGSGTHAGPNQIQSIWHQLDHSHPFHESPISVSFLLPNQHIIDLQSQFKDKSCQIIQKLNQGESLTKKDQLDLSKINQACKASFDYVYDDTLALIKKKDPFILCGGEHGVGLGYVKALGHAFDSFSVLQIDAHMDCRISYFGYDYSHASVITHYASMPHVNTITQVGIRDYDQQERLFQEQHQTPFHLFLDYDIHRNLMMGDAFYTVVMKIINTLSSRVFISLDVDGLAPYLCPNTGTPVPGGLSYNQLVFLFEELAKQKQIVGAELVEVSDTKNSVWNANVGARLLQLMAGLLV